MLSNPKSKIQNPKWPHSWVALLPILALAAGVRFYGITHSSLWHDEAFTVLLAKQSFSDIVMRTTRDVHPPFYYFLLHLWMNVFGTTELAVRSLSAVLGIASVPVAYALSRRLFDEPTARLSALFVALGPFLIRYSQETRMYALAGFLLLLATWLLVRALQDGGWKNWLGYSACVTAALYTHYFAVFAVFGHALYLATQTQATRQGLRDMRWWGSCALAALLYLPWLPILLAQFSRVQEKFWVLPVGAHTLTNSLTQQLFFADADLLPGVILAVIGVAWLLSAYLAAETKDRAGLILLSAYTLAGPLAVFVLSFKRPIYVERCFIYASLGFYMLLAVLIMKVGFLKNKPALRGTLIALILLFFGVGISNVREHTRHPVRDIARQVGAEFKPGDELVSGELFSYFDFQYYNPTGTELKLWASRGLTGVEETSLLFDRADTLVVKDLSAVHPQSGILWMIGKSGKQAYFDAVPHTWEPVGERIIREPCAVQKFRIR